MTFKDKICFVNASPILGKNISGERIMNINDYRNDGGKKISGNEIRVPK